MAGLTRPAAGSVLTQPTLWRGTDDEFLAALRQRDRVAMGVLFDRFEATVNRLVWRFLGADPDHDDVVRQVFLEALEHVSAVRSASGLEGWITSLAVNTVRSELRRRRLRRWLRLDPSSEETEEGQTWGEARQDDYEAREALRRTYSLLGALPADQQIAFVLRHFEGQSLEQTAESCSCSLATIKRRLSRAEEHFCRLAEGDPLLAERLASGRRWGQP